jgi:hypothetical protein
MPTSKRLKSVSPLQSGKVLGILYGLASLLIVPFALLFSVIAGIASQQHGGSPSAVMVGMGLLMMVGAPVFYAALGFLTGLVGAWIYNLVAGWIGGIEFVVE